MYARLKNVTVVPSGVSGDSVSYLRLRALDSMIGRLRNEEAMVRQPDESQLEHQQRILEEAAKRIADDTGVDAGLLLNISA
jgi:hypothetical protein